MRCYTACLAAILACLGNAAMAAKPQEPSLRVVGWVENVHIPKIDSKFKAKLDTGATTSSLHAEIIGINGPGDEPEVEEPDDASTPVATGPEDMQGKPSDAIPFPPDISARKGKPVAHPETVVVFSVTDANGEKKILERRLVRWVKIKKKEGGHLRRPVVRMTFCIGGRSIREEVNLADRGHFIYPVLIGRNMLAKGNLAVDSSRTFTAKSACPKDEAGD